MFPAISAASNGREEAEALLGRDTGTTQHALSIKPQHTLVPFCVENGCRCFIDFLMTWASIEGVLF